MNKGNKPEKVEVYEDFLNVTEHVEDAISDIIETAEKLSKLVANEKAKNNELGIPPLMSMKKKMKDSEAFIDRIMTNIDASQVSFKLSKFLHVPQLRRTLMDSAEFRAFACSKDSHHLISKYHLFKQFNTMKNINTLRNLMIDLGDKDSNSSKFNKSNLKALIIGSGPAGLRLAINLVFYGIKNVTIVEQRDYFSRKQIVKIWNFTECDLISLGIRDILPNFTKDYAVKTVPITYLQHFLLRVALLLEIKIITNMKFDTIDFENGKIKFQKNKAKPKSNENDENDDSKESKTESKVESEWIDEYWENDFNIIADASGVRGVVRDLKIPKTKSENDEKDKEKENRNENENENSNDNGTQNKKDENKSDENEKKTDSNTENETKNDNDKSDCDFEPLIGTKPISSKKKKRVIIGITANFKRVKKDFQKPQILGKARFLYQKEFNSKDVSLENIVHFRSEISNYMVATVTKESLSKYDIFVDNKLPSRSLVNAKNVKKDNLRKLIIQVATEWDIPHRKKGDVNPFIINPNGKEDFNIFEFGNLKEAQKPLIFKCKNNNNNDISNHQIICCTGDSAYAPFWPKGTGVNHAFIGTYIITEYTLKWFDFCNNNDIDGKSKNRAKKYMKEIESLSYSNFHDLSKDLHDKEWHKQKFAKHLPEYDVHAGVI